MAQLSRAVPLSKSGKTWSRMKRHWQLYLILVLPVVSVAVFNYAPMYGIILAFKNFNPGLGIWGSEWAGLKHFNMFFTTPSSRTIIVNTLTLSALGTLAGTPFAILLAISLNEMHSKRYRKLVQLITYAPYFISTVVLVSLVNQFFASNTGMVNIFLKTVGLKEINFFNKVTQFRPMYIWSGVWQGTGYSAIIYLAALTGISPELYEAATVDGASRMQRIWHLDLPGITPTIITLLLLSLGSMMSVGFEKVFLMQNAINLGHSEVISTYVYKVGMINSNYSFSAAIGLFNSIVNLILVTSFNYISRAITETSLW